MGSATDIRSSGMTVRGEKILSQERRREAASRKLRALLWVVQGLLAALFLFAGGSKLAMPADEIAKHMPFSVAFMRFVGVCEALGGLGLVLPTALRILPALTPIAAAGLIVIMIGAIAVTVASMPVALATLPFVTGLLLAFVAYGRWRLAPIAPR